jgi:hypothetical protein
MNGQPINVKSASPLGEGERIEVRELIESAESDHPHPSLSLEKGEATDKSRECKAVSNSIIDERTTI